MRNIVQNESRESSLAMPSQNNVSETNERTYRQHNYAAMGTVRKSSAERARLLCRDVAPSPKVIGLPLDAAGVLPY